MKKNKNKIVCGDILAELRKLPKQSVDLFLFSPPYDGIRNSAFNKEEFAILKYHIDENLVDGGIAVMVLQDQTKDFRKSLTTFRTAVDWCTFGGHLSLFECLIYQRPGRPGNWWSKRFRVDHEYILVFLKGNRPQFFSKEHMLIPSKHAGKKWSGTQRLTDGTLVPKTGQVKSFKCPGTVLNYASSNTEGNKLKMKHPSTMPDKLATDIIQCFTKPGMVVCDPCCGSGTTLVQAKKLGRKYIGFDINEEYVKLAEKRLEIECK